jgi:hypothetical protein
MNDPMSGASHGGSNAAKPPFHLWVVGLLLVLWNGWGIAIAIAAQTASLPSPDPEVASFFAAQPLWLVVLGNIGPVSGIAGSVALLLQSRWAPALFGTQLGVLTLANAYEVAIGTSLLLSSAESRVVTLVVAVTVCGAIVYARAMARRGVLY